MGRRHLSRRHLSRRHLSRRHLIPALIAVALGLTALAPMAHGAGERRVERELAPGVRHVAIEQDEPALRVQVARVAAGAPVDVRVVTAHDQIAGGPDGGLELTTDMCRRAGAVVCLNGDFAECTTCGPPLGGVVRDGRVLRSFRAGHDQLSLTASGPTTAALAWSGRLVATYAWPNQPTTEQRLLGQDPGERTETRTLSIDALNRTRPPGSTVLYTPEWAPSTMTADGFEAVLATTSGGRPGAAPVSWRATAAGDAPIPVDGAVVSASGEEAEELRSFWDRWHASDAPRRTLTLETSLPAGVLESVGGHPVLLRDGRAQPLDASDTKVTARHPRTLAGWTADGELLLVAVDGRQPGRSEGLTLAEATELMRGLGATDAVNLDGGGSTTFAGPCPAGTCVLNRPSDGRERRVTSALVVVPRDRGSVRAAAAGPTVPASPPPATASAAGPAPDPPSPPPLPPSPAPPPGGDGAGTGSPEAADRAIEVVAPEWPAAGVPRARAVSPPAAVVGPSRPARPLVAAALAALMADLLGLAAQARRGRARPMRPRPPR